MAYTDLSHVIAATTYCSDTLRSAAIVGTRFVAVDSMLYNDSNYSQGSSDNTSTADLLLSGINCAACGYKIELGLRDLIGVSSLWVNYAARRLTISFDPEQLGVSDVVQQVRNLGYDATPWQPTQARKQIDIERRDGLKRLGITAVLGMQVMTIAVALYFGNASGIDADLRQFLMIAALTLTVPVLVYGARPFYVNATRAIRAGRVDMDLTVCLAITLAFVGSFTATITGHGDTYFESICMFVFLLTGARLIETTIRLHASQSVDQLANAAPEFGIRVNAPGDTHGQQINANAIKRGDVLFVTKGESIAADGVVVKGQSGVNEALLTGESELHQRQQGDRVLAGSINAEQPLWVRVDKTSQFSTLSQIRQLADRAQTEKPQSASVTDPIAAYFLIAVLVIAAATALIWLWISPSRSLPVTIALLAVACPCALSLAAPAAFSAAADTLIRRRVLPTRAGVINSMNATTDVVFDKTGTLTLSGLDLSTTDTFHTTQVSDCITIASSLEHSLSHPVARAFQCARPDQLLPVDALQIDTQGVTGTINGTRWHLGSLNYVNQWASKNSLRILKSGVPSARCWLLCQATPVAAFTFAEHIRPDSASTVSLLRRLGMRVHLLSGDQAAKVDQLAESLDIDEHVSGATPRDKLDYIHALQQSGCHVAMIGDGINDSPALAGADVSVAVDSASPLAAVNADLVILGASIAPLAQAFSLAKRTHRIVKQNLSWALAYNSLSIPLAAVGLVPAWLAAIGMSVSSLVVVTNALRLRERT